MPRAVAPPPSGEFTVRLTKPFNGQATTVIEVIGEPNRPATARSKTLQNGKGGSEIEKVGDVPAEDVNELMSLITTLRGFPSHPDQDVFGHDTILNFATMEIQWSNKDENTSSITDIAGEQKDDYKRVSDSIEALARTFAKKDSAV
ncbi:hypothetical protein LTR78_007798 [Recurvomyces mirabilis]|uniref:Uncharacterized protein n=1 Tax=Recurvomyces mirabilis TaxID=574656 RepID=A0AAE0WJ36_9PEZI|nr:hypothetical protein LTR78_007798 [Recurvomyces mirabilis]KAK5160160.1 hypothetical protein LTS14_002267 [Recurvomyces mirabilis]